MAKTQSIRHEASSHIETILSAQEGEDVTEADRTGIGRTEVASRTIERAEVISRTEPMNQAS
eukprot:CAMPEP_0170511210 /NCGR_PEP_ID=MMETSP0208-20121228/66181_1 /TAXON_ID=197538 /ORGANISM="Strombidium inclinatum, Strain S3" /LENGTH=61 /DNA_ID=CAMNT_0010794729 /DNA_START=1757 /DNA_END=1938 /DNA_ORIENTATION=-